MWTGFRLKNFKGYRDSGLQELRPLTVLIGPNGGGKSTLLQFLMMLKQTVESTDTATTLITSIERGKGYVDLGLYKDYVFKGRTDAAIEMDLTWKPVRPPSRLTQPAEEISYGPEAQSIGVIFGGRGRNRVVVERLCYGGSGGMILVALQRLNKAFYQPQMANDWKGGSLKRSSRDYAPEKFYRFSSLFLADLPPAAESRLRTYVLEFEEQARNTYYLGPLREHPQRYYVATGDRPVDLGLKGEKIGAVLYAEAGGDLIRESSEWLQRVGLARSVGLSRIGKGKIFELTIRGLGQGHEVNIADYGFGASQILPVIVESLHSPAGSTVLVEQPEIHLNAHHQLELPGFFAQMIRRGKQFIVETHSEYFLKRLNTLIAKGKLQPEDVIVLYCFADREGTHIHPITLDGWGQYSWWPQGFLAEGFEGATEHLEELERLGENGSEIELEAAA